MKNEIKVPSMGESISEAVIGTILTTSGKSVKADEPILEIETDKVNQLLYAPQAGIISLTVEPGDVVKIGQIIGTVDAKPGIEPKEVESKVESKEVKSKAEEIKSKPSISSKEENGKSIEKSIEQPVKQIHPSHKNENLRKTKKMYVAELKHPLKETETETLIHSLDKKEIRGSPVRETRRKMSTIRKVIAKRLIEAQQTTAMLTTFNEIDMSQVIQLREKYKESFIKKHEVKLGFMSFFVTAVVSALEAFPDMNSFIEGEEIVHREYYDIGVAVGTDKGLIVPVVRDCDKLSFAGIESAIETFAKKAKDGTIKVEDLQGGGFTITNGGVYGSLLSTPILNPPQSGILGMHKIEKRPVVVDDQIVIRSMMYVALSYDHRIVDGKTAVSFLVHIKNLLEDPSRFMLDV